MPIAFARLEFVKRSAGKNSCGKAAYNSRSRIHFQGSEWQTPKTYNWSSKTASTHHEVLLPKHVDLKFQSPELLWNTAEQKEVRRNSQTALEMVLALPDDQAISVEDRIHLSRTFAAEHFVSKGLAAQIDIHSPEQNREPSEETREAKKTHHNWHAHILITTRRFKENGLELETHKARDLMPIMRGGQVISGPKWGRLWAQHQNTYFENKGLSLRVDAEGIVPQIHLGPVRMRSRAFSLLHENSLRTSLNSLKSEDPKSILEKITQTKNIFTPEEVDAFLHKHIDAEKAPEIHNTFWKQEEIIQLLDSKTHKPLNKFTTKKVLEEEKQVIRLGDRLFNQKSPKINSSKSEPFVTHLTEEQREAFQSILNGQKLSCIEGHAGTGKSHLLQALKYTYESNGFTVRGFGPDSATSNVLKEKGFSNAENIYRFLFSVHHNNREITKHQEIWLLDEAGKLGTRPLLEFLKFADRNGAKVILSGNSSQLPSIERGCGFTLFSQRYNASLLENIQRQKEETQREVAKKLALGEIGHALDSIVKMGHIKWTPTKEKALELLITQWARNRAANPNESTLIIAHSNKEVHTLNELVRLYRKEAGELVDKEYHCETAFGKIYISKGDTLEFRKNNKELGVTNGTEGVLTKVSDKSFTVQIKEEDKTRHVTFDPRRYRNYQLGYATTYYRSQGRTVDKAYVLHSKMMNKEMFYVGLTRHAKKAELYISETEAKYLSDVKRQAFKSSTKESTLVYHTYEELEKERVKSEHNRRIETLKSSDSLTAKLKGFGLSVWSDIYSKTSQFAEKQRDRQPDQNFFKPKIEQETRRGSVKEVAAIQVEEELSFSSQSIQSDFKRALGERGDQPLEVPKARNNQPWKKLSEEKRQILKGYFKSVDKASSLYTMVKSDSETNGERSSHFQDWQKACVERNSVAYEVSHTLKLKELRSIFGVKGTEILQERATKHNLSQQKNDSQLDLDGRLKENMEAFLHKLFPEGPIRRDSKSLRFGSKGSLAVTLVGSKAGSFYDFERQEGGGPIQLIQRCFSYSQSEAIRWAKVFIGEAPTLQVPTHFSFKGRVEKDQEWVSLKPDVGKSAPSLKKISKGLNSHYYEAARYTYRGEGGRELFHVLRLESKQELGKKIVLPLSYGYYRGNEEAAHWSLKGYQVGKKPLYNLHLLKQYPTSQVLTVEGEKTADAASKLFPREKIICLTWSGGAGAVGKSDWTPLFMRDVVIWPDNDKAGFEASESICRELKEIGVKSLREVDRKLLAKELPPKWDLADRLPDGKSTRLCVNMIFRANKKEQTLSFQHDANNIGKELNSKEGQNALEF